ncbi:GspE/PulE family protein [Coraliomargarita akajimensis]|uniref:Type II secretion system protein E n=1 Tax=Coraliomargarita akajimensis (strain DSM 45221 / IAM 15411 / JCM 23193 / KCTC 12865 / 04OKA010-24) TaxID=583355 RepID=D5EJ69_CORAD|nr:ATPase, T2SS/T4P/T4SS family [Coraliomargarita akajimensis]ADE54468.1 type II secretion system protein E [Coraliomargarita akajimensis DSM 45221]
MTSADDFVLQLLLDKALVDDAAIESARAKVADEQIDGDPDSATLDVLTRDHVVSQMQIAEALAEEFSMEVVDLTDVRTSGDALEIINYDIANRYKVFPLEVDDTEVELAICDPLDMDAIDSISHVVKRTINTRIAPLDDIERAIHQYYDGATVTDVDDILSSMPGSEADEDAPDLDLPTGEEAGVGEEEAPIIRYVHMVISEALRRRASDIHMEPLEKRFRVRYRIDGVLHEVENPPKRLQPSIVSRIKLMSNVSIAEKRVPQDGRINIKVGAKVIDLRVSTLPTAFGESIVMRILDKEGLNLGLPQLGFFSDDQATFERIIALPDGIFLVTGPTGSGKSTTLYSALNYINHPDRKIITVEDPVEYEMAGINQVQVKREVGMTFVAALRSMLRQAPNIIMVGEIRDKETAEIAVNASLTGHMVFSTLHTNDAPSAVSRLVDIGIKPFLVSASLRAVLAQRLVRRTCAECKAPDEPDPRLLNSLGIRPDQTDDAQFARGKGCSKCNSTGFRGRVGIFEMFTMNEELQQMVYEEASLVALRNKAREMGMRTMREDGVRKILAGVTTAEEVLHVTVADPT